MGIVNMITSEIREILSSTLEWNWKLYVFECFIGLGVLYYDEVTASWLIVLGLTMLSFHKDATSKQNESIEEIEVLTTEVTKAIEKKEEQLRDTQKLLDRVEFLKKELRKESEHEEVKLSMRRPSKFNEEVAAFEARIASVKKGFDAKLREGKNIASNVHRVSHGGDGYELFNQTI